MTMDTTNEVYISVDVETDGPIPGPNSMLSLGAAAFTADGTMVGTFSMNLDTLEGASGDPDTMAWWRQSRHKQAWEACRKDLVPPVAAMNAFTGWVDSIEKETGAKPVCVAYPAGFDFLFLYWYLRKFTGDSPFSFSCLDIKTYAMAVLRVGYRASTKKNMPKRWFSDAKHTHVAVDDAIEQGLLFIAMLKENVRARG